MKDWNDNSKRILKSELVRKGISNLDLSKLLNDIGVEETKSSIDSKISRGTFSASFFLQCLTVIGCNNINISENNYKLTLVAEPQTEYIIKKK